ncbi:UDP-glucose 4-epimerase GalE [Candidatus Poriferisodalis sp.]|uniref:UDP-glucose 4-epimerase GalE n=1 Tax=Candidatus Poriferisodalis sp. TaxID=3101277 RepID=UPI003B518F69
MSVLVTGGAGYIGSVVVDALAERGERVVVVDNLSRSSQPVLPPGVIFESAGVGDSEAISRLVRGHGITSCIHLAGLIAVGESVRDPGAYIENNFVQSARLIRALLDGGVELVVFSSSAAVYGNASTQPITESAPLQPTSPYGWTKLCVEQMLRMHDTADDLRSVSLRYFNAAGATSNRTEQHNPETHLVPLAVRAASERQEPLTVFGSDYPTPDGTAIRDYIHISDLVDAHLLALGYLRDGGATTALNLGGGTGHSVLEVIAAVERGLGRTVRYKLGPRRAGDPAELIASPQLAQRTLNWVPSRSTLAEIVASLAAFDR